MIMIKDTDPGFIKFVKRIAIILFPWMVLMSCHSLPVVLLHGCQIPESLDYEATGPIPLPSEAPLPARDAVQLWASERHLHAGLAHDYNDFRAHVKTNCQ